MITEQSLLSAKPAPLWKYQYDALGYQLHQQFPRLFPMRRRCTLSFASLPILFLLSPTATAAVCGALLLWILPKWQQVQAIARGWYEHRLDANPSARDAYVQGQSSIRIVDPLYDLFLPTSSPPDEPTVAFVFLPGALVDARAYGGICRKISQRGNVAVVLLHTDRFGRLASPFFGLNEHAIRKIMQHATDQLAQSNRRVGYWCLGGHSFGGLTAQELLLKLPEMRKLVQWGVYNNREVPLSKETTELMITASCDGFRSSDQPPPSNAWIQRHEVKGGNHSGFGDYPKQMYPKPDGERTMSLEEQHDQVARSTAQFLLAQKA